MSASVQAALLHSASSAAIAPTEGSRTLVGTLATAIVPVASSISTRSVCVPPTSTPTRFMSGASEVGSEQMAAGGDAAVARQNRAGDVAGARRGGERDEIGNLIGRGGTAERQRCDQVLPRRVGAGAVGCLLAHQ